MFGTAWVNGQPFVGGSLVGQGSWEGQDYMAFGEQSSPKDKGSPGAGAIRNLVIVIVYVSQYSEIIVILLDGSDGRDESIADVLDKVEDAEARLLSSNMEKQQSDKLCEALKIQLRKCKERNSVLETKLKSTVRLNMQAEKDRDRFKKLYLEGCGKAGEVGVVGGSTVGRNSGSEEKAGKVVKQGVVDGKGNGSKEGVGGVQSVEEGVREGGSKKKSNEVKQRVIRCAVCTKQVCMI